MRNGSTHGLTYSSFKSCDQPPVRFSHSAMTSPTQQNSSRTIGQERMPRSNLILLGFAVVFLTCYASALTTSYGFLDDYPYLYDAIRNKLFLGPVFASGRPLHAFLIGLFLSSMTGIDDLRYLRLFGVLGMATLGWRLCLVLVRRGWIFYQSIFLSIVMLTLPPFQLYATWAINSFYVFAA